MGYEKTIWKNGDLITADKMNHAEDGIYQANESIHMLKIKQIVRFVIATSTAGWTQEDCDYLCDGIDDQIDINKAIQELPEWGGEIKILDGIYHINSSIELNKPNTKLSGNGFSTTIQKESADSFNLINVTAGSTIVENLKLHNLFDNQTDLGIRISSGKCICSGLHFIKPFFICIRCESGTYQHKIYGCSFSNAVGYKTVWGVSLEGGNSVCMLNESDRMTGAIQAYGSHNIIIGNVCSNEANSSIYIPGNNNLVVGNTYSRPITISGIGNLVDNNKGV